MPTQNVWDNFLFDLASSLSFGLVTDLKTLLLAAVFLGFLAMGFDMLVELLHSMSATSAFDKARKYFNLMRSDENLHGKDSPEYDYHSRVYGVHMNNAVNQSFAAGKPAYEPDIISTDDEVAGNSDFTPYLSGGDEQLEMESSSPSAPLLTGLLFRTKAAAHPAVTARLLPMMATQARPMPTGLAGYELQEKTSCPCLN